MKIEEGMYVRTKCGYICKVVEKFEVGDYEIRVEGIVERYHESSNLLNKGTYYKNCNYIEINDIKSASYNLIDLIEIYDIINGMQVTEIKNNFIQEKPKKYDGNDYSNWVDIDRGIAIKIGGKFHWNINDFGNEKCSAKILTHENFERYSYKEVTQSAT